MASGTVFVWSDVLVEMGLFPSVRTANRLLYKESEKGTLYRVGSYVFRKPDGQRRKGHPTWIYSTRPIGPRFLEHQIFVMQIFNAYRPHMKGFAVGSACHYNEDLTHATEDDAVIRWEADRATERIGRVRERLNKFTGCEDMIVFATVSRKRIADLKKWAAPTHQREQVYFCLMAELVSDPFKRGLIEDINGDRYEVYRKPADAAGLVVHPASV